MNAASHHASTPPAVEQTKGDRQGEVVVMDTRSIGEWEEY
jgi:hypothetical protein